ncbi:MAG TPA: AAA family ATPase, partial [Polyangia bacterium]
MKVAITGKGGVGKTTVAASLARCWRDLGYRVVAVDADPDANLAQALGISEAEQEKIVPIARQAALIEERTGAKVNQYGQMFKIN